MTKTGGKGLTEGHDPGSLLGMSPRTLGELLADWGQPPYRARQILEWVYQHGAGSCDEMTNLPAALRSKLAARLPVFESKVVRRQESADGAIKLLLEWADGATSESVLIPDGQRQTVCISTQVGCPVGCVFCASGVGGLQRQLTTGQIVEQAMRIRQLLQPPTGNRQSSIRDPQSSIVNPQSSISSVVRLSNVVLMGLGEPLANYDATIAALRTINADWGVGVGARKITVSTVGLPKQMRRLADEKMQITLALSLHAPTDELRKQIIPWAERVDIASLVEAANYYFERTGREVTLEYVLLGSLNDGKKHAEKLAGVAKRMRSNVNLIQYNPVEGLPFQRPTDQAVQRFLEVLRARGVNAHLRRSRGLDIDAACGQLRRRKAANPSLRIKPAKNTGA